MPRTLFEEPPPPDDGGDGQPRRGGAASRFNWTRPAQRGAPSPAKPPSPLPVCCICLEDIEEDARSRSGPMRCSQCTMQAHPACLSRWFAAEAAKPSPRPPPANSSGPHPLPQPARPASTAPTLLRSTASCPSCRCELDWDALALQARRRRASGRRRQQDEMRHQFERECEFAQECE